MQFDLNFPALCNLSAEFGKFLFKKGVFIGSPISNVF